MRKILPLLSFVFFASCLDSDPCGSDGYEKTEYAKVGMSVVFHDFPDSCQGDFLEFSGNRFKKRLRVEEDQGYHFDPEKVVVAKDRYFFERDYIPELEDLVVD